MMDGEAYQKAFLALLECPEVHHGLWRTRQFPFMLGALEDMPDVAMTKASATGVSESSVRGLTGCVQVSTVTGTEILTKEAVTTARFCGVSLQELTAATESLRDFGVSTKSASEAHVRALLGFGISAVDLADVGQHFAALREPEPDKRPYWRKLERRRKRP